MSFFTSSWLLPQKEHNKSSLESSFLCISNFSPNLSDPFRISRSVMTLSMIPYLQGLFARP